MSKNRRQRSTMIRKRIEKKRREDKKAAIRAGRRLGKDDEMMLTFRVDREVATKTAAELKSLGERLTAGPIRGWTTGDIGPDANGPENSGLLWLAGALTTAAAEDEDSELELGVLRAAQSGLLDKLNALEMAASGLGLDWDAGFLPLSRSISHAEEPPPEEEDEE
ncbi:MAG: hypothetical protein JKY65_31545 [Planctomycetes bacterium]|nr:hypothetical protein [Planctomycetota bacterium]